jgi:carbonic anhydrase/acetyltransferase-like protein (isoleucine patch superfamily)
MPWLHPTAVVHGDVILGDDVSLWPTAVIRGDTDQIVVGDRTNVQDGAVIHADPGVPTVIGRDCVIGHRAIVHGATLEDAVLVGMGAIVMNRVRVGTGSVIGAGAVCTEGMEIPPGSLVLGVPARVVKELPPEQAERTRANAARYVALSRRYAAAEMPRRQG